MTHSSTGPAVSWRARVQPRWELQNSAAVEPNRLNPSREASRVPGGLAVSARSSDQLTRSNPSCPCAPGRGPSHRRKAPCATKSSNDRVRRFRDQSACRRNELQDRAAARHANHRVMASGKNSIIGGSRSVDPGCPQGTRTLEPCASWLRVSIRPFDSPPFSARLIESPAMGPGWSLTKARLHARWHSLLAGWTTGE
jgi:hypothetical protein